ncbi:hypothetical protein D3C76_1259560 [compost metagenome]
MTNFQHCQSAVTLSACLKNVTELFYVTHPKLPKALLGPFLTEADAECGRVVMRSADTVVTACQVRLIDESIYRHAVNNGRVCRAFAGDGHSD